MFKECLSFDDVLLLPVYSDIRSRLDTNVASCVGGINLQIPIISSAMDTVTEWEMAAAIGKLGGMGIIHRFLSHEQHAQQLSMLITERRKYGKFFPVVVAVGVKEAEQERLKVLMDLFGSEIDMISLDIANGHSVLMKEMIDYVRANYGDIPIMAGNVATSEGFRFLAECGANAVRIGIGGGSICKTRVQSANGSPTFQSVFDAGEFRKYSESKNVKNCSIIADGGIKYPKDMVLCIAAGADAVMVGGIFAGTNETPGEKITINGEQHKLYRGMASSSVQNDRGTGLKPGTCAEGVTTHVKAKGPVSDVVIEFIGGLRSGMSYQNSRNISELRDNPVFIKITSSGLEESHAYGTKK